MSNTRGGRMGWVDGRGDERPRSESGGDHRDERPTITDMACITGRGGRAWEVYEKVPFGM